MCKQYAKSVQKSVEQVYHHKHNKSVAKVYHLWTSLVHVSGEMRHSKLVFKGMYTWECKSLDYECI